MKVYIKEIFQRPLNTIFISIGTIIAIYCLSIGISFFNINFDFTNDRNIFVKNNFTVQFKFDSKRSFNTILTNLDNKDENNSFLSPIYQIDIKDKNRINRLTGVYNYTSLNATYPLYSGRFFSKSELLSEDNIAMIGYAIIDETYIKEGKKYIDIQGHEYRVIGVIGRYTSSYWNIQILVPFKALPKDLLSQGSTSLELLFSNDKLYANKYFDKLKKNLKDQGLLSMSISQKSVENASKKAFEDDKSKYMSLLFTVGLALISLITFSTFWVTDLKRNFAIKRILGANNFNIIKMLCFEISFITIICKRWNKHRDVT